MLVPFALSQWFWCCCLAATPEFRRKLGPALATLEIFPWLVAVLSHELLVPLVTYTEQPVRGNDRTMRPVAKKLLDLPQISARQSPVIRIEHTKIENAVTLDAPRVIDVTLGVTQRERARRLEERLATMKSRITRSRDGTPTRLRSVHVDHMIE